MNNASSFEEPVLPGVPLATIASKAELDAIKLLRVEAAAVDAATARTVTDDGIMRFLHFTGGDMAKTKKLLRAHVLWRQEHAEVLSGARQHAALGPSAASAAGAWQPSALLQEHLTYTVKEFCGHDKDGVPIAIVRGGLTDTGGLAQLCTAKDVYDAGVWAQERMFRKLAMSAAKGGKPCHQVNLIIDLHGIGMHFMRPAAVAAVTQYMTMSVDNYPEEFCRVFLVRAPAIFPMLFRAVKNLIPEKDQKIVQVLGCDDYLQVLRTHINDDQIPAFLGGSLRLPRNCEDCIRPGGKVGITGLLRAPSAVRAVEDAVGDIVLEWKAPPAPSAAGLGVHFEVQCCADKYFSLWQALPASAQARSLSQDGVHRARLGGLLSKGVAHRVRVRTVVTGAGTTGPWHELAHTVTRTTDVCPEGSRHLRAVRSVPSLRRTAVSAGGRN